MLTRILFSYFYMYYKSSIYALNKRKNVKWYQILAQSILYRIELSDSNTDIVSESRKVKTYAATVQSSVFPK